MSRKNIFDTLANKYKIDKELQRIAILFKWQIILDFLFGNQEAVALNCKDMKSSLGLVDNPKKIKNIDKVLDYLEYYINICNLVGRIDFNLHLKDINIKIRPC